jgi:hypothetical protein
MFRAPLQQFACTRDVRKRHIFDVMHVSQRVLDYQDIAAFDMFTVHFSKSSQQAIGRGQVHEIVTEDGERCWPSVGSVMHHHLCEVQAKPNMSIRVSLINPVAHRIGKAESSQCPHCHQVDETVHHYLITCPFYRRERHILAGALGRKPTSISFLLTDPIATPHLVQFVNASGRMRGTFGEIPLPCKLPD